MNCLQVKPQLVVAVGYVACSQRSESRSESHFGSRPASWFELCVFTSIGNVVPIMNRICALRGNILFLLRRLTHAWFQCAFPKCTRTNHVLKELCIHMSSESGFLVSTRITIQYASFFAFQKPDLKELCVQKGKIRLSNQERVRITSWNGFRNAIRSFVNKPMNFKRCHQL